MKAAGASDVVWLYTASPGEHKKREKKKRNYESRERQERERGGVDGYIKKKERKKERGGTGTKGGVQLKASVCRRLSYL